MKLPALSFLALLVMIASAIVAAFVIAGCLGTAVGCFASWICEKINPSNRMFVDCNGLHCDREIVVKQLCMTREEYYDSKP